MNWWLEYASIRQGWYFTGIYQSAVEAAQRMCSHHDTVVWIYDGQNRRVAEVTQDKVSKTFPALQGSRCP